MSAERYRDLELIAKGGMGEVFRATMVSDAGVEKPVALKLLRTGVGDGFLEEAKIAMAMSHGNIVQTFDAGHREGRPFLAMELVEGTDLAALIARGPIPAQHALTIVAETLRGLEYAHRLESSSGAPLDVVHRDISPANLLLSRAGEVKIADFGIARTAEERQREQGVRGKMAYMPPEQLAGGAVDARADLYALGVVLYEMVSGSRPFAAADPDTLRARIKEGVLSFDELPAGLRDVVRRSMHREAARRYSSAAQMREAIEDAARDAGVRISTSALREWIAGSSDTAPSDGFDARLGALLGGERTGTLEVGAEAEASLDESATSEPNPSTRPYTALVVLALLVAAAMPFVGFAFDEGDDPLPRRATSSAEAPLVENPTNGSSPTESFPTESSAMAAMTTPTMATTPTMSTTTEATRPAKTRRTSMRESNPTKVESPVTQTTQNAELWIASEPWAHVSIDGQRVGRTTLRGYSVPPGPHVIVLSNPSANLERRIDVDLEPGERKRLSVSLDE